MSINSPFAYTQNPGAVPPGSITNNELADMAALTVKGNPTNATDEPQDIAAAANDTFFGRVGDVLGFFSVAAFSAVTSVFGRTGAVVASNGDYTASQVTNVPSGNIAATNVQAAINELDTEKVAKAGDTMTGPLTVNVSGATSPAPLAGTLTHIVQAAGLSPRYMADAYNVPAGMNFRTASGSPGAPGAVASGATLGFFTTNGHDGSNYTGGQAAVLFITTQAWTPSARGTQFQVLLTPTGSATQTGFLYGDFTNGLSLYSATTPFVDANRLLRRRVYTFATLPSAVGIAGAEAIISDGAAAPVWGAAAAGGGAVYTPVFSNNVAWVNG